MRFYYTPSRITITNSYNLRVDEDMKKLEILYCCGMKNGTTPLENTLEGSYKFKRILNIRPSYSTPGSIHPRKMNERKHISTQGFMHKCSHQYYS